MTLQIKMVTEKGPFAPDALGRTECGYYKDISQAEAWLRARAEWPLIPEKVMEQGEALVIGPDGTVLAVATITGTRSHGPRKIEIYGDVLVNDARVGEPSPYPHDFRQRCHYV